MPNEDVLCQILRTPDHTQADIQRVEELITAEPSIVSVKDEEGRTPIEALASRGLINSGYDGKDEQRSYQCIGKQELWRNTSSALC